MLLLKQDNIRNRQENEEMSRLEFEKGESNRDSKEYKIKAIHYSTVYTKEAKGHLLRLYYQMS